MKDSFRPHRCKRRCWLPPVDILTPAVFGELRSWRLPIRAHSTCQCCANPATFPFAPHHLSIACSFPDSTKPEDSARPAREAKTPQRAAPSRARRHAYTESDDLRSVGHGHAHGWHPPPPYSSSPAVPRSHRTAGLVFWAAKLQGGQRLGLALPRSSLPVSLRTEGAANPETFCPSALPVKNLARSTWPGAATAVSARKLQIGSREMCGIVRRSRVRASEHNC